MKYGLENVSLLQILNSLFFSEKIFAKNDPNRFPTAGVGDLQQQEWEIYNNIEGVGDLDV